MKIAPEKRTVTIRIESNLEDVALVGAVARMLASRLSLAEADIGDIELAVSEAVNNAILHAYRDEPGHLVEIKFTQQEDELTIDVCDQGRPMTNFEPTAFGYDSADPLRLPERGMGLFIIGEIMDEAVYRSSRAKNVLTMTRRIKPRRVAP